MNEKSKNRPLTFRLKHANFVGPMSSNLNHEGHTMTTKQKTIRYRITNNDHGTNWVIGTIVAMYDDGWDPLGFAAFYYPRGDFPFPAQGMAWGCAHAHESEVERID